MAAERFEEWLKTPADEASQDIAVDLDLADPGGPLHLVDGGNPDKADFHPLDR